MSDHISSIFDKPDLKSLNEFLMHYGVGHDKGGHSGRYPWGSGDEPYQHNSIDFVARVKELRKQNIVYVDPNTKETFYGDTAIAKHMGIPTKDFKSILSLSINEIKTAEYNKIKRMSEDGMSPTAIGKELGKNESSIRSILDSKVADRYEKSKTTAELIRQRIDSTGKNIQIGSGVEKGLNISPDKFNTAITLLKMEGYETYSIRVPQVTDPKSGKETTVKLICPPGTKYKDAYNLNNITTLEDYISKDGGDTFVSNTFKYPGSLSSKRVMIRYADDVDSYGAKGIDKDGVIEIRRNVPDLSLGEDRYAQVRILVDKDHYLKGMAMYSDDIPEGYDVVFNTNKKSNVPKMDVLKEAKKDINGNVDKENPFGSAIKEKGGQATYIDPKTGREKLGLINKTRDEGDWNDYSNKVPAQFLSKQSKKLAKQQLDLTIDLKKDELNDILAVDNPTLRKRLLYSYAEDADSSAIHLKAASLPRQRAQVILPMNSLKDNEIYARNYENGEKVALIRYPHAGTFEIPILTVNNKNKQAIKVLGDVQDAVGINSKVASILSGADFDGDVVTVIPTNSKISISSRNPLEGLEGFDPKLEYGPNPKLTKVDKDGTIHYYNSYGNEYKIMDDREKQTQMGIVSNLITDMTIKGANDEEMAAAVRHSMVVIDAVKHHLDYKSSEQDNNINLLKQTYQKKTDKNGKPTYGGSSTIISRAKGVERIDKTQGSPKINIKGDVDYDPTKPEGSLIYKKSDQLYYVQVKDPKTGKWIDAYDQTPKSVNGLFNENWKNNDKEKIIQKIKDGNFSYLSGSGETKSKVTVKGEEYRIKARKQESTKMAQTDDAYSLISETNNPIEILYANFANSMKDLANKARLEYANTKDISYSPSAKVSYSKEVDELDQELMKAEKNAPREKQALVLSNSRVDAILASNPDIGKDEEAKIRQRELTKARNEVGAHRYNITITDKQWEAIQAGAISPSKLSRILDHTDLEDVKERATPRKGDSTLSVSKVNRLRAYADQGYTADQISDMLDISVTTVYNYLNKKEGD